jgi:hypothetical protein
VTIAREILIEAMRRGFRLEATAANRLAYFYDDHPPSREFLELMRQHKPAPESHHHR